MICAYCKQDVLKPCNTIQEIREQAAGHVERCEEALSRQRDASQGQGGGSI